MDGIAVAATGTTTTIQVWTLVVAGFAVVATLTAAWLLRRTGKGQVRAARNAARAAELSAQAAQDAVGVNRDTAAGVAARAEADALAKRYQDAANQLGSESPAIRVAAVHALARLGDDWLQERQTCLDVLCAYLQLPLEIDDETSTAEIQRETHVQQAILEVLRTRFAVNAAVSWSDLRADFTGCVFENVEFRDLVFKQPVSFRDALFAGRCSFDYVEFEKGADLTNGRIVGDLSFNGCGTTAGELRFDWGVIEEGAELYLRPGFREPRLPVVSWMNLQIAGFMYLLVTRCFRKPVDWMLASFRVMPTGEAWIGGPPSLGESFEGGVYPTVDASFWFKEEGAIVRLYPWLVKNNVVEYSDSTTDSWQPAGRVNTEFRAQQVSEYPPDEPQHDDMITIFRRRTR